jgi:hypothetical protein
MFANQDDLRDATREWVIDLFAEHIAMDATSRHILDTFLKMVGDAELRATLIDDGTLVLGIKRRSR